MEMNRVSIVSLIVEYQAIAFALLQRPRLVLFVEPLPIDGPSIESALPTVYLAEHERDYLVRLRDLPRLAKDRVVPTFLGGRDPFGRPAPVGIFDHDAHAVLPVVIIRRP